MPVRPRRGIIRRRAVTTSSVPATSASASTGDSSTSRRRHAAADTDAGDKPKRTRTEAASPRHSPRRSSRYNLRSNTFKRGCHRISYNEFWWSADNYAAIKTDDAEQEDVDAASVSKIDLNKEENKKNHHGCSYYDVANLVVRRGQAFSLAITLDRDYDPDMDIITLQVTTGSRPVQSKNSLVRIPRVDMLTSSSWGAAMTSQCKDKLEFNIMIAADAVVGKYTLYVETSRKTEDDADAVKIKRAKHDDELYVLFNTWCKEDDVYLEKDAERVEYVMNDRGRIWVGSSRRNRGRPWYFGQYEHECLEAAVYLLEESYLGKQAHGNPVQVVRALTAMANSNDEDGVLTGNWSGDYEDGISPSSWNGSYAILQKFMEKKKPVEYGQCWVFSGILTTLCRTLGIPTRSVTNFESAHDTDFSMTIDTHFGADGKPMKHLDDSVWNFHVWNEAWMKRHDLPDGNDGWQAIDATPQECSEGTMRCGPAPLNAIKRGSVYLGYDTKFIFAEVNGDRITWLVDKKGAMKPVEVSAHSVGMNISTKRIGSIDRLDVTNLYKYPEGSKDEREAVQKATLYSSRKKNLIKLYEHPKKDVAFVFKSDMASNGTITYEASIKNKSAEARTVAVRMHTVAKYYTGATGDELGNYQATADLQPNEKKSESWTIPASEWMNNIAEDATIGVYFMAEVKETGQIFTKMDTTWLDKPDLELKVPKSKVKKSENLEVTVSFTNPLCIPLTGTTVTIEGAGIVGSEKRTVRKAIKPDETIKEVVKVFPTVAGEREVIASLNCRQLSGIHGSVAFTVTE